MGAACREEDGAAKADDGIAALRPWLGAFGEGLAMIAAAGVADDDDILRQLAMSTVSAVRKAVLENGNASEEVRALAALGG